MCNSVLISITLQLCMILADSKPPEAPSEKRHDYITWEDQDDTIWTFKHNLSENMLSLLIIRAKNVDVLLPNGTSHKFIDAATPYSCGVFVHRNNSGAGSCRANVIYSDVCENPSTVSLPWPPQLKVKKSKGKIKYSYAWLNCEEKSKPPVASTAAAVTTPVKEHETTQSDTTAPNLSDPTAKTSQPQSQGGFTNTDFVTSSASTEDTVICEEKLTRNGAVLTTIIILAVALVISLVALGMMSIYHYRFRKEERSMLRGRDHKEMINNDCKQHQKKESACSAGEMVDNVLYDSFDASTDISNN